MSFGIECIRCHLLDWDLACSTSNVLFLFAFGSNVQGLTPYSCVVLSIASKRVKSNDPCFKNREGKKIGHARLMNCNITRTPKY